MFFNRGRIFCAALAATMALQADQVTLKNGDKVTGKIVDSDAKTLTVKSEFMGEVKIDRTAIVGISSDAPLNVTLKDGRKFQGTVAASDSTLRVEKGGEALASAALDTVTAIRDDAAQKAWEREQERLTNPRFGDFWSGFVGFSLASASGNANTTTVATSASATRDAGNYKLALGFNQMYSTQSTTAPFGVTANRLSGTFRIDRNITSRMFLFGNSHFDYDQFLDLDLRSVFGGGLGWHVWKSQKGFWDVSAGGGWNREKFGSGLVRNSGELMFGEESEHRVNARLKLFQKLSLWPNMTDTGEFRFGFNAGAVVPVFKWLEWTAGVSDNYLSNPPAGKLKNDTIFNTGVRVSFDQTKR